MRGWALKLSVSVVVLILLLTAACYGAPAVSVTADAEVPVGRNVLVKIEVSWEGEADHYDVPQPDLPLMEGLELVDSSLSSQRRDQKNLLVFSYSLRADKPGAVTVGPIEVQYFEKGVDGPLAVSTDPIEVRIVPARRLRGLIFAFVAALAAVVVLAAVMIFRDRGRTGDADLQEDFDEKMLRFLDRLEAAKELRLSGDMPEYFAELVSVADLWSAERDCAVDEALKDIAERVRFAGYSPTPYELDWSYRVVEDLIKKDEAETRQEKEIQLEDEGD